MEPLTARRTKNKKNDLLVKIFFRVRYDDQYNILA
jgi:hypothetical protein